MTNQEIKTVGQTIAAETQIGGNTAERVGGVIEGIGEALDNKDAAVGYYLATMSGSTIYINASSYRLGTGGNLRAKMPAAATTACTLTVGNANAVPLWYNGAAVSADNSWEAGEIVTIFYDGTRFIASNSQGGGGKAEKIKYDNSQSELDANNVQEAIDEVAGAFSINMADADLDIGDKNGNILARFADGGIQTKRFNSDLTPKQGEGEIGDLEIADENNHILARFYDGHIKTKYFDSKEGGMKSVYNVLSMGAVGDGETDDTIAIQNTLERGGLIVFPSGLYLISSPLIFKSNTTILMSEGAEIKRIGTSASCVLRSYSELTDTGYNGVHDVHIIGGCINANGSTTYPRSCIAMIHVKDIIIEGVTFKGQSKGMHSIDFAAGKNVKFKDCIFTDIVTINSWGECIQIDGANSTTSYPYLSDIGATDASQIFDDVGCEFIEICGCTFYLNEYSPAIGNHNYSTHNNINIHDNTVIGLGVNITTLDRGAISFNIWSGYPNQHNQSDMVFIHHNIIDGCYYGFSFDDGSDKHIYIRDNILTECGNILKSNSPCAILLNNIENN